MNKPMKITVTTNDLLFFAGADAKDVVRKMKEAQWNAPDTKREYMEQVGQRVMEMTGQRPREDATGFLIDLERANLVTIAFENISEDTAYEWLSGKEL